MGNVPSCCAARTPKGGKKFKEDLYGKDSTDGFGLTAGDAVACGSSLGMAMALQFAAQQPTLPTMAVTALNLGSAAVMAKKKEGKKRYVALGTACGFACARTVILFSPPPLATWTLRSGTVAVPMLMLLQFSFPFLKEQFENSVAREMFDGSTTTLSQQASILTRVLKWGYNDALIWFGAYTMLSVNTLSVNVLPLAFTNLVQSVTVPGAGLMRPVVKLTCAVFGVAVVNSIQAILMNEGSTRLQVHIQKQVIANIMRQDTAYFEATAPGEILQQLSTTGAVAGVLTSLMPTLLRSLIATGTTYVVLSSYDSRLAMMCLVAVPFDVLSSYMYSRYFEKYNEKVQAINVTSSNIVMETINSIKTVRLFAAEKEQLTRFWNSVEELIKLRRANNWILAGSGLVDVLLPHCTSCLLFLYASHLARGGSISVASLITVSLYQSSLQKAFEGIMSVYVSWASMLGKTKKVFEMMDRVPKEVERGDYVPDKMEGSIRMRDVTFSYSGTNKTVLKDFNLTIRAGETVAIVGPSGSGKSTVVNLILGLYDPTEGSVCIDGVPVHKYDPKYFYTSAVSVVSQEPALFSTTFAKNISLGVQATPEEIETAAKRAHAHDFIMKTKEGYDTKVGARGELLSGGQRQRVAIARALVRNPAILLLDEATSALDGESESIVQEAVDELMVNRTVLVVAHRLSTVQKADRILVMAQGRIVQEGTHSELLKEDGLYKQMVYWQLKADEEKKNRAQAPPAGAQNAAAAAISARSG